jgi:hypothetical protein
VGRAVRERAVVLFSVQAPAHGRAAVTLASLVARDVLAVCAELRRIGVPGDGLVWFDQCGAIAPATLAELLTRGAAAGLPALLTSTSPGAVQSLADQAGVLVLHRLTDAAAAARFAGLTGDKLVPASGDLAPAVTGQARPKAAAGAGHAAEPLAAGPADAPGQLSQLGPFGLVRRPVVAAQSLSRLADGEHVLVVRRPRPRLVTLGLTVRARIPSPAARPAGSRRAAGVTPATAIAARTAAAAGEARQGRAT